MIHRIINGCLAGAACALIFGCAEFDSGSLRPTAGAPPSAQVEQPGIPYDPALPRYVVVVEPIRLRGSEHITSTKVTQVETWQRSGKNTGQADGQARIRAESHEQSGTLAAHRSEDGMAAGETIPEASVRQTKGEMRVESRTKGASTASSNAQGRMTRETEGEVRWSVSELAPETIKMSAQLVSALTTVENYKVMTHEAVSKVGSGRYSVKLGQNEAGPFVFRALITEYEAMLERRSKGMNVLVYDQKDKQVQGVVGIDVEIIDGRDGSIVSSFPVRGTFGSRERSSGSGILPFYDERQFARSILDQALRVALNDAAVKSYEVISKRAAR